MIWRLEPPPTECSAPQPARRRAFTLIEVLLVISIITLIAATVLFAVFGAMNEAKADRTRAQIAKLHEIVMTQWETYHTRRLAITVPPNATDIQVAYVRLDGIRQLMRMEMPERITDLFSPGADGAWGRGGTDDDQDGITDNITEAGWVGSDDQSTVFVPANQPVPMPLPARTRRYFRFVHDNQRTTGRGWSPSFQGAECLYMIVAATVDEDGESPLDFFSESEVGDYDQDGMKEFLDGWGLPIEFLRWPAGFTQQRGPDGQWGIAGTDDDNDGIVDNGSEAGALGSDDQPSPSLIQHSNAAKSPDFFDPRRIDLRWRDAVAGNEPYALYPLIFSAGKDEVYGIMTEIVTNNSPVNYGIFNPLNVQQLGFPNPYQQDPQPFLMGTPIDENLAAQGQPRQFEHVDNISNHAMEVR